MITPALCRIAVSTLVCLLTVELTNAQAPPPAAPPAPEAGEPMVDAPWFKIGWPKVALPEMSWKPFGGEAAQPPTAPKENPVSAALDRVSAASSRAAGRVRNAWGSATSKLPFGGGAQPDASATAGKEPGFWSRLFAPEPDRGSETITEFLAQERPSTVR